MKTKEKVAEPSEKQKVVIKKRSDFIEGVKDGFPICIGYIPIAISFGIIASSSGFSFLITTLMSALSFTGTGQFTGMIHIIDGVSYFNIALSIFIVNLRCFILSLTLAQRLDPKMALWKRLIISFGNADETFIVAMQRKGPIGAKYFTGLVSMPYLGWVLGTVGGILMADVFPQSIRTACGIALYALFVAIIVPPMKKSKPVVFTVVIASICSAALYWIPFFKIHIDSAISMIIGTVIAAVLAALRYPVTISEE